MPIMTLHYKNFNDQSNPGPDSIFASQRLKMSAGSVPVQKLRLIGYAINILKHATLAGDNTHKVPDHIVVELDQIATSQINNASPPETHQSEIFPSSHGIPLPLGDDTNTIQFGMSGLEFDINKKMNRVMQINVKYFNSDNKLVPMTTTTNNTGQVAINHILLYFSYDFSGNF